MPPGCTRGFEQIPRLSSPRAPVGRACASATRFRSAASNATRSPVTQGFNVTLGATVDDDTAKAIAEALIDGGSAVVAQFFDIRSDPRGDVSSSCDSFSLSLDVGGTVGSDCVFGSVRSDTVLTGGAQEAGDVIRCFASGCPAETVDALAECVSDMNAPACIACRCNSSSIPAFTSFSGIPTDACN